MSLALDQLRGDRRTKQVVVYTLCGIAGAFAATVCALALRQLPIPDALDRLITYVVGVLSGMLIKTGVDKTLDDGTPIPVTAPEPLPVENVTGDTPLDENEGGAGEADEGNDNPDERKYQEPSSLAKAVRK